MLEYAKNDLDKNIYNRTIGFLRAEITENKEYINFFNDEKTHFLMTQVSF